MYNNMWGNIAAICAVGAYIITRDYVYNSVTNRFERKADKCAIMDELQRLNEYRKGYRRYDICDLMLDRREIPDDIEEFDFIYGRYGGELIIRCQDGKICVRKSIDFIRDMNDISNKYYDIYIYDDANIKKFVGNNNNNKVVSVSELKRIN